jgi:hypothetical protein
MNYSFANSNKNIDTFTQKKGFPAWVSILMGGFVAGFVNTVTVDSVRAATLGLYNFDGNVLTPSSVDSNLTLSDFSVGSGISANSGGFANGSSGRAINYQNWTTATSIDTNDYYEFTVTPNSNIETTLDSLAFDARRSNTGPQNIEFRSSLNSYSSSLSTNSLDSAGSFSSFTTTLPSASFTSLTSPITFRIYGYSASGTAGTFRLDNVTLYGSTQTVPFEFSPSLGLLLVGACWGLKQGRKLLKGNSQN